MYRVLRVVYSLNKLRYYKELAKQMKINVPPINDQINLKNDQKCYLVGYRKVQQIQQPPKQEQFVQQKDKNLGNEKEKQLRFQLVKDQFSREQMKFKQLLEYVKQKQIDICVIDQQQNQVGLERIRQKIYHQYYWSKLYKVNSKGKKYKQIKIPQKITQHDLKTKASNIKRLVDKGQKMFKIVSDNDSIENQNNLRKFLQIIDKEHIAIEDQRRKDKKNRQLQRFTVELNYQKQIKIDYELVNKKWRRKEIKQQNKKTTSFSTEDLDLGNENFQLQRQILQQLYELGLKFPKNYKYYQDMLDVYNQQGKQGLMKHNFKAVQEKMKNNNDLSGQEQKQTSKGNDIFKERTVEDILEDMQKLKQNNYELDAFENFKYKRLQNQLKQTLKKAGQSI